MVSELKQTVLILAKVWPEPVSSASGRRMMQLIALFRRNGYSVSIASVAKPTEFSVNIESIGIPSFSIELNSKCFDRFISDLKPNIVVFDRFSTEEQFGWRVAEHSPDSLRILDTEDLHGLRMAREKALKEKRDFTEQDLFNTVSFREIASVYRCDVSLIISEFEMDLLQHFFKVPPVLLYYLPFLIETKEIEDSVKKPGYSARKGFISIGNFLHAPNLDAVKYLYNAIWPLIRKRLPEAELHIYGAYVNEEILKLNDPDKGFLVKGRAENAGEVMQDARLCLAPLRFGAGLKGKLLEAMLSGTPSICSSIGAEGMKGKLAWPGCIEDDPNKFADAAAELYSSKEKWEMAASKIESVLRRFDSERFESDFVLHISDLRSALEKHRLQNFTGAMLQQQNFSSSKYLALWIEAKNKLNKEN